MEIMRRNSLLRRALLWGAWLPSLVFGQPLFECSERLVDPYGICSHISRPAIDFPLREQNLAQMNTLGVGWVRTDLDWYTGMKDGDTRFDPTVFDSTLISCEAHGVRWLPVLDRGNNQAKAWEDVPGYLRYIRLLAEHYRGRLDHWEVINEVNLIPGWTKEELGRNYAAVLRAVYDELKRINPDCRVVYGGQGEVWDEFLETVCKEGFYQHTDVMNFHTYNAPEELPASFRRIRSMMDRYGWSKPVWLTETGFHTQPPLKANHSEFYRDVLPEALRRIGLKPSRCRVAIVYDVDARVPAPTEEELLYYSAFREVRLIRAAEVKDIDAERYQLLVPSYGEFFPGEHTDAVVQYVRDGGTLLCPRGVPFAYNASKDNAYTQEGMNTAHGRLHMGFRFWWDDKRVPEVPTWCRPAEGMSHTYTWHFDKTRSSRFLTDSTLKPGDRVTPLVQAGNEDYTGTVAALYEFDSELKGNIIVQTRMDDEWRSEAEQARRLPRAFLISFAYGIDKVFWYKLCNFGQNLDDHESHFGIIHSDFSPKPAFAAMKTLTELCPEHSTRPVLTVDGDLYEARWQHPDGRHVTAIWTTGARRMVSVKDKPLFVRNHLGENVRVKKGQVEIGGGIIYLVSSK